MTPKDKLFTSVEEIRDRFLKPSKDYAIDDAKRRIFALTSKDSTPSMSYYVAVDALLEEGFEMFSMLNDRSLIAEVVNSKHNAGVRQEDIKKYSGLCFRRDGVMIVIASFERSQKKYNYPFAIIICARNKSGSPEQNIRAEDARVSVLQKPLVQPQDKAIRKMVKEVAVGAMRLESGSTGINCDLPEDFEPSFMQRELLDIEQTISKIKADHSFDVSSRIKRALEDCLSAYTAFDVSVDVETLSKEKPDTYSVSGFAKVTNKTADSANEISLTFRYSSFGRFSVHPWNDLQNYELTTSAEVEPSQQLSTLLTYMVEWFQSIYGKDSVYATPKKSRARAVSDML